MAPTKLQLRTRGVPEDRFAIETEHDTGAVSRYRKIAGRADQPVEPELRYRCVVHHDRVCNLVRLQDWHGN
jgi:hypothetical protein